MVHLCLLRGRRTGTTAIPNLIAAVNRTTHLSPRVETARSPTSKNYESFEFDEHVSLPPEPSRSLLPSGSATRDRKLYPGADLSTFQCYLLVFQYAIRHSLTTKAFTELLQLIAVHLPKEAAIPRSVHNLKRFFVESYPELQPIQHYYCSCCQRPLLSDSSICNGHGCSGGSSATFITIPTAQVSDGRFDMHVIAK